MLWPCSQAPVPLSGLTPTYRVTLGKLVLASRNPGSWFCDKERHCPSAREGQTPPANPAEAGALGDLQLRPLGVRTQEPRRGSWPTSVPDGGSTLTDYSAAEEVYLRMWRDMARPSLASKGAISGDWKQISQPGPRAGKEAAGLCGVVRRGTVSESQGGIWPGILKLEGNGGI